MILDVHLLLEKRAPNELIVTGDRFIFAMLEAEARRWPFVDDEGMYHEHLPEDEIRKRIRFDPAATPNAIYMVDRQAYEEWGKDRVTP